VPELKNVAGTAFIIAQFRAEENRAPAPLYRDPYVELFLNRESARRAAQVVETFPLAKEMVKLRTRYFDDRLSRHLATGLAQVVILGSGLDTRPQRLRRDGVRFFEIDHPDTLAFKQSVLRRQGITAPVTFVPGDYLAEGVFELLASSDYEPARASFFLWEGNSTYLSMADVRRVLRQIRERASSPAIAFDYMSEKVITRTTGHDDLDTYIDHIAAMGAPWLSGIDDLGALAGELGLEVEDRHSASELFARYRPGRSLESKLFDFYFVATLLRP